MTSQSVEGMIKSQKEREKALGKKVTDQNAIDKERIRKEQEKEKSKPSTT